MSVTGDFENFPPDLRSAGEKMRDALALYEQGVAMQRLVLQRQQPSLAACELDALLDQWLARETDEACWRRRS
jgi:hypothetical protein